jgi:hypothetical protein
MRSSPIRLFCRLLVVSLLFLSLQSAHAGMITAGDIVGSPLPAITQAVVINRADLVTALESRGVQRDAAAARVAALTDEEMRALVSSVGSAPAGAMSDWATGLMIVAIVLFLVSSYNWKR